MVAKYRKDDDDFYEVEINPDVPIYTTGVVCTILAIPVWVLKQLDTEGIVSPPRESESCARLYSKKELKLVQHCWYYMKTHKVKVHGLKIILQMEEGTFKGA
jgi:DNA-binding transcriptional MerR regulator